jgi:hypothetical protein
VDTTAAAALGMPLRQSFVHRSYDLFQRWEKQKKAARDLVRARPELGTNGGAPTGVRRAVVGLTSGPYLELFSREGPSMGE